MGLHFRRHPGLIGAQLGDGNAEGSREKGDSENEQERHGLGKEARPAQAQPRDETEGEETVDAGDNNGERRPNGITPETFPMAKNKDENVDPRDDDEAIDEARLEGVAKQPRGKNGAGRN